MFRTLVWHTTQPWPPSHLKWPAIFVLSKLLFNLPRSIWMIHPLQIWFVPMIQQRFAQGWIWCWITDLLGAEEMEQNLKKRKNLHNTKNVNRLIYTKIVIFWAFSQQKLCKYFLLCDKYKTGQHITSQSFSECNISLQKSNLLCLLGLPWHKLHVYIICQFAHLY